jgi:aspartate carbamoyltransferase catalytic subunit|tara:strand:- start:1329 stop:2228 length:900 start_codon:yes stop_codon:yes gene_type:complete
MRHLTTLKELSKDEIIELLDLADNFIDSEGSIRRDPLFPDKKVVNIFCEPSTRTKISFEVAASNLGCQVIDFNISSSSLEKGETLKDTIDNLAKMNINLCVLRHKDSVIYDLINQTDSMVFISGGEGATSHPSQGLLDIMTVRHRKDLEHSNILIVGDLDHSRVFQSFIDGMTNFDSKITLCGPKELCKNTIDSSSLNFEEDLNKALKGQDVVMALRIQHERFEDKKDLDKESYLNDYQINNEKLQIANDDCIVMHPGPVNQGIEISESVYNSKNSVILDQVANGVAMRMAILIKYLSQ